jgi:hypothetical protein
MLSHKIIIILLNWNGKNDTLECLSSLKKVTFKRFSTLVVDNGSTDGSVAAIRQRFPETPILETGENLGFAGGNNPGIKWALSKKTEWILLLNNDTIVAPDFLDAFLEAAKAKPKAKILGAKIYRYGEMTIDHLGGYWDKERAEFASNATGQVDDGVSFEEMQKVDYVCGAALLMHRSVPEAIGLLEPRFFLFWEETDFCMRARKKGFEVWTAPKAKIWHKVSASFVGGKPHMHYFWWRSRLLWIERNCPFLERKRLYSQVIFPELWKEARHFALKSIQSLFTRDAKALQKARRYRAGLTGAFHYSVGRFGNCPNWALYPDNKPK